jgi:hypothetical protein
MANGNTPDLPFGAALRLCGGVLGCGIRWWGMMTLGVDAMPETRYVEVGDADVAYQVVGDGSFDLLFCYGLGSHLESWRELPAGTSFSSGWRRSAG